MVKYICEKCNKEFNHKGSYDKHMNRKKSCIDNNQQQQINKNDLLIAKLEEIIKDNQELKKDNKILKKEISKLKKMKMTTNINKGTINKGTINNEYKIIIQSFGDENDGHLNDKQIKKILGKGYYSIPEYVKSIHFDKEKEENHNIYMPNWRDKTKVLVYDGDNWNLEDSATKIDDLKSKGIDFIEKYYDDLDPDDTKDAAALIKIDRLLNSYNNDDKEKMAILHNEISLVLYNNRSVIEKTRKKRVSSK
jgi:hypothetical protein